MPLRNPGESVPSFLMPGTPPRHRRHPAAAVLNPRFAAWSLLLLATLAPTPAAADEVTVAAVQFEVSEELYASPDRLEATVESLVVRAVERFDADVVVFPEYVNVFLVSARHPEVLTEADDLEEALAMIAGPDAGTEALSSVFQAHASWIAEHATAMWSRLADRHDTVLVAGTLFVPASGGAASGRTEARADGGDTESELRNRLLVFDESGALIYTQDKVFLTPFERDYLRLEPGTVRAAEPVVVDGLAIGFTICRDSFFDEWDRELGDVDLWIALRANGEPYTREVYARFLRALPERVASTDADAGVTASLTGEFLGEVWAGPSYAVDGEGRRIAASSAPVGTEITAIRVVERGGEWVPVPVLPGD